MHAGKTDGTPSSRFVSTASASSGAVGVTGNGHAFTAQPADHLDRFGVTPRSNARAALNRRHTLDSVLRMAGRLRGQQAAEAAARRAASVDATSPATPPVNESTGDSAASAAMASRLPVPLRYLPMMHDRTLPPLVIPSDMSSGTALFPAAAQERDAGPRASFWARQLFSAMAYRLRYWTAPGEHRKALRMTHASEKLMNQSYVFLNAMLSDEALTRHSAKLQRRVRRLDKRAGVLSGISDESVRVLQEAADCTAGARDNARHKILSFNREDLLYDAANADEFHHLDGVLLVLESRMVAGIALYGHALRCIAAVDVKDHSACMAIGNVLETVFAREAAAAARTAQPREWLGCAVGRLPYRTLRQLYTVLSTRLACGGRYQAFLDELALIVEKKANAPMRRDAPRDN